MTAPDEKNETPLNQGLDSKTNQYVASNGAAFQKIEGARHDEPGTLIKRLGTFELANAGNSPALDTRIVTKDHKIRSLMKSGGSLGLLHDTGLLAYTDTDSEVVDRPKLTHTTRGNGTAAIAAAPFTLEQFTGFAEYGGILHGTIGTLGEEGATGDDQIDRFAWYDADTGVLINAIPVSLATLSILIVASGIFRVLYQESNGSYLIAVFDGTTWNVLSPFTAHTSERGYAAASTGPDNILGPYFYVIAPKDNTTALHLFRFDATDGTQSGASFDTGMVAGEPGQIDIDAVIEGFNTLITASVVQSFDGAVRYERFRDDTFTFSLLDARTFAAEPFDSMGTVAVFPEFGETLQTVDAYLVHSFSGDDTTAPFCRLISMKGNAFTTLKQIDNARLIGKPFKMGGGHFALLMHDILRTNPESTVPDPICLLIQFEDTVRGWSVAGFFGVDRGYDPGRKDELPAFFHFKYRQLQNFKPQPGATGDRAWILHPDFPASTTAMSERVRPMRLALDSTPRDVAQFQGGAYSVGAQLQQWIGSSQDGLVANAFAYAPTGQLDENSVDGVVLFPQGEYIGSMVLTWVDDLGQAHRSAPAPITNFTAGSAFEPEFVDVLLPPGAEDDVLELYMSGASGTRLIFYGSVTRAQLEANGNVAKPLFSNFFRPGIEQGQKFIYTDGGALANIPQPAAHSSAMVLDRLWLGDAADRQVWWFSKPTEEGVAFEFNAEFRVRIPGGTAGTATAQINGRPLLFTSTAIWTVHGDGPLRTGAGAFSLPAKISSVGCLSHATVVETPAGVFFAGERGLYRVIPGLQVQPVALGADFEFDASEIVRATVDERTTEVKFFRTSSKGVLIYNYLHDKLSTWPGIAVVDAAHREGGDQDVLLKSSRRLEDLSSESSQDSMILTTNWIKLDGFQGNATIRELFFSAEQVDPHGLTFDVWFDYEDSTGDGTQVEAFTAAVITGELAGDVFTLSFPLDHQTARAVKVRITETETAGRGFKPLNLTFNASREDGIQRRYGETGRQ